MKIRQNYIKVAKNNEVLFRLILDKYQVSHEFMSIEQIYEKYTEGNRYGIWTILDFKEKEPNVFEFSQENIATMSGRGGSEKYTLEDGKLKFISSGMRWMS
ncbi:MAG: hypothetical protein AABY22_29985 [Nanoarchaeota archaeon]